MSVSKKPRRTPKRVSATSTPSAAHCLSAETLKLYVWTGVFRDYTDGIAFALAGSALEARALITKEHGTGDYSKKECARELKKEPMVFTTPVGYMLYGGG